MKNSKIEWTDHTFNPWTGCARVSPACESCYAETFEATRFKRVVWGVAKAGGTRHVTRTWNNPPAWNRQAERDNVRARVFCASLADVFDEFPGRTDAGTTLHYERDRLFHLIEQTPYLDWLLLTKRPQNIEGMLPALWLDKMPHNVWLGTTVEDQRRAEERLPHLLKLHASVRFISVEPQLEEINLSPWIKDLQWVFSGGESGPHARPMAIAWARRIRDQCLAAGVPFLFKQWGNYAQHGEELVRLRTPHERELDGRTWDELPGAIA